MSNDPSRPHYRGEPSSPHRASERTRSLPEGRRCQTARLAISPLALPLRIATRRLLPPFSPSFLSHSPFSFSLSSSTGPVLQRRAGRHVGQCGRRRAVRTPNVESVSRFSPTRRSQGARPRGEKEGHAERRELEAASPKIVNLNKRRALLANHSGASRQQKFRTRRASGRRRSTT
jgi:hypothetical protein